MVLKSRQALGITRSREVKLSSSREQQRALRVCLNRKRYELLKDMALNLIC